MPAYIKRVGVISDLHLPLHDPLAWKLTKKIIPELNLDLIYLLGDIIDFESLTSFLLDPNRELLLQRELDISFYELQSLRTIFPGKMRLLCGNHEFRHYKYLFTKAPRLANLRILSLPNLLRLKELDIDYYDNSEKIFDRIGKLNFFHGDEIRVSNTYPARNLFNKILDNAICGHHHIFDDHVVRSLNGNYHGVFVNGTLQKLDPRWAGFTQWHQGISVIDFSPSGYFDIDQLRYFKKGGKMMVMMSPQGKKLFIY